LVFAAFSIGVMVTALVGGWRPATAAALIALLFAWYCLASPSHPFAMSPDSAIGLLSGAFVAAIEIGLIEILRSATRLAHAEELSAKRVLAERDVMFSELQHRVANSMQLVAALLTFQARRAAPGRARQGRPATGGGSARRFLQRASKAA